MTHISIYTYTHLYTHINTHLHTDTHTHARIHTYTETHIHKRTNILHVFFILIQFIYCCIDQKISSELTVTLIIDSNEEQQKVTHMKLDLI